MKKYLSSVLLTIATTGFTQQIHSFHTSEVKKDTGKIFMLKTADDKKVFLDIAAGGDALNMEDIKAAGILSGTLMLSHYLSTTFSFNVSGNEKVEKADSVAFDGIFFPDISKSSFLFSPEISLRCYETRQLELKDKQQWDLLLIGDYSLQKRKIKTDTITKLFYLQNWDIGLCYRWSHSDDEGKNKLTANFSLFPYDQVFVNPHSEKNFKDGFNITDTEKQYKIMQGLSFLFAIQYNDYMFYFRSFTPYEIFHQDTYDGDFYFTIGARAILKSFSF